MGTSDAYQATALQQRKQKPRCRMYWNSADGPSRVFTVYKKRNRALIIEWPLFLGIYFPQLVSSRISFQRPRQQLSMTSAPSKGEAGWPLSPCQDVLITWMLRIRAYNVEQYFYSLSASHTSFSCRFKENYYICFYTDYWHFFHPVLGYHSQLHLKYAMILRIESQL